MELARINHLENTMETKLVETAAKIMEETAQSTLAALRARRGPRRPWQRLSATRRGLRRCAIYAFLGCRATRRGGCAACDSDRHAVSTWRSCPGRRFARRSACAKSSCHLRSSHGDLRLDAVLHGSLLSPQSLHCMGGRHCPALSACFSMLPSMLEPWGGVNRYTLMVSPS